MDFWNIAKQVASAVFMKKILILFLLWPLILSSCGMMPQEKNNNEAQNTYFGDSATYQLTTIQTNYSEESGPIVELQGEYPVFEYQGKNIQYDRFCEDMNQILDTETESWTEIANEILIFAQEMYSGDSMLATFSFEVNVSCEVSNENGYPAVIFNVREVRSPGSGGERNYQIKYHTDDGTIIYRTLTETTRVY